MNDDKSFLIQKFIKLIKHIHLVSNSCNFGAHIHVGIIIAYQRGMKVICFIQ